ncbi:hypothetical protein Cni_G15519 [Canna indica]|uniref:Uncharacterized protein n=1 Tax=Canna indica TaxID=4628 RepID=A0AAQ3KG94_9LILI|nr:hypothetical protein Cni_G15519 [Canna indica]
MADSGPFARRGGVADRNLRQAPPLLLHRHRHRVRANWSIPLLIGRATARRLLAPPSSASAARDSAPMDLEERNYSWGYSRRVVALDVV